MKKHEYSVRLGLLFLVVCLFFTVILVRLVHFQVFKAEEYNAIVERQATGKITIPADRGILYDRNGRVVANNVVRKSVYAFPKNENELKNVASYLDKKFDLPSGTSRKRFKLKPNLFRWIDRRLPDSEAKRLLDDAPTGLHYEIESDRVYPYGLIGKQIFGFTNIDTKGQSGIELMFNDLLAGKDGTYGFRRDAYSNTYRVERNPITKPVSGESIILTIDMHLQELVEEELKAGVERYRANAAMAVFINNNNGEILAMAHYDPDETRRNKPTKLRAVTDMFEPGSIFKGLTGAGFIEAGIIDYEDTIYCEEGEWQLNGRIFHDDKKLGWLTFREIIELSSNIGMAKYAIELSGEALVEYLEKYTVSEKIGLGWPGETSGSMHRYKKWSEITLANLSVGHGVATSALQMAAYFGAIANGGKLYKPSIVLSKVDNNGNPYDKTDRIEISEVMSKTTSDSLRSFMKGVVEVGTATEVKSDIIAIGGKTGTAQIYDPERRRYSMNKYMASFAGFFPADDPLITGIVVYERPRSIHYGGYTAGPVFKNIAERFVMMNPDLFTSGDRYLAERSHRFENTTVVPDLTGHRVSQAMLIAEENHLMVRPNADSGVVIWQYPPPDRLAFAEDDILVAVSDGSDTVWMPDLSGLSIREVSAFFSLAGIKYTVKGNGKVHKQSIKPGSSLTAETVCAVECRPS